ncbi:sulfide:quinone oxidoreductase flavo-binding protein [Rutstroemia sp. NJR-2017a WRK4]|nr:sulfide:quinone oxidoreductase flavo-binding protein [Rutstroemia sp. NJR-2017a WRK4]
MLVGYQSRGAELHCASDDLLYCTTGIKRVWSSENRTSQIFRQIYEGPQTMVGRIAQAVSARASPVVRRSLATVAPASSGVGRAHKVVVVGGGAAGMTISHQLLRSGQFTQDDIAVVDPATWHHYQPGWTLVGGGLKDKKDLRRPLASLVDSKIRYYQNGVQSFAPTENTVTLANSDTLTYEHLVVVPGIHVDLNSIKGLAESLSNPDAPVSSIYSYEHCDKTFPAIKKTNKGVALFTHPAGPVKCAGAPQKIMWLALDHWKRAGLYNSEDVSNSPISIKFASAMPVMFGVPKYSATLDALRQERGVDALFQHDLTAINGNTATFTRLGKGDEAKVHFDFLHAVPKMGPHAFIKNSPIANEAGFVDVDDSTTQHRKYTNVWSAGDASSLPTSKTAAAITAQAPVLVANLLGVMNGSQPQKVYDGYTSCPLTTEYGKVLLAEFKYGGVPKETFGKVLGIDQGVPRRAFYYLKKDFFPWVYYNSMMKGTWGGPRGWLN